MNEWSETPEKRSQGRQIRYRAVLNQSLIRTVGARLKYFIAFAQSLSVRPNGFK